MEMQMEGREELLDENEWTSIHALIDKMTDLKALADRIRSSLTSREGNLSEGETFQEDLFSPSEAPIPVRDNRSPLGITEWTIKPG